MKHEQKNIWSLSLLFFATLQLQQAHALNTRAEPEAATKSQLLVKSTIANHHLVVAANPHASRAGRDILRLGGSAVDAAIAVQMVLNLVEPQSSGIGGGGFLMHWDQQHNRLTSFDGRETAPARAKPDRFMRDGKPMKFREAVPGGLSVGIPGLIAMLELAHKKQGRLPWRKLFQPAIHLARTGFKVSLRLNTLLQKADPKLFDMRARTYFFDQNNQPRPVGYILKNPGFRRQLDEHSQ